MSFLYAIHYTQPLISLANTQLPLAGLDSRTQQLYGRIDAVLKPPFTPHAIQDVLTLLQNDVALRASEQRDSSEVVSQVVLAKVALGLYANALDLYLGQASAAQHDAEWWAEVEQSNRLAAFYLLQSKPATSLLMVVVDNPNSSPETCLEPAARSTIQRRFTSPIDVPPFLAPRPVFISGPIATRSIRVYPLPALEGQHFWHVDAFSCRFLCRPRKSCPFTSAHSI